MNATIKVVAGCSIGKLSFVEAEKIINKEKVESKLISFKPLKDLGVASRWNSFVKIEKFFNTDEGIIFFDNAKSHDISGLV